MYIQRAHRILFEKRRTKNKQERKILFQFDSTEMSTPHSFIHRRNIVSIAWRTKKKKKKKNENYEKIGEKEKNRIEMNVYECEMGRYKLCLSGCRANTRGDGVRGIWINKTQSSEKKIVNRRRE